MATIIELGGGGFIAGDPPTELELGHHWCEYCGGDGLDYDYYAECMTVCGACSGACVTPCADTACLEHSSLHPNLPS